MTDWNQLFRSDEFRAYRKRQAEAVAEIIAHDIEQMASGNYDKEPVVAGKLSVIRVLLRLPETLTGDEKVREQLEQQLQEDVGAITQYLVRQSVFRE